MKVVVLDYVSGSVTPTGVTMTMRAHDVVNLPVGSRVAVIIPDEGEEVLAAELNKRLRSEAGKSPPA